MLNFSLSTKNLPHLNLNKNQDENHSIVYPVQLPSLFSTLILGVDVEVVDLHVVATLLVDGQSESGFVEVSDRGASLVCGGSVSICQFNVSHKSKSCICGQTVGYVLALCEV